MKQTKTGRSLLERYDQTLQFVEHSLEKNLESLEKLSKQNYVGLKLVKTCLNKTQIDATKMSQLSETKAEPTDPGISNDDLRFFQRMLGSSKPKSQANQDSLKFRAVSTNTPTKSSRRSPVKKTMVLDKSRSKVEEKSAVKPSRTPLKSMAPKMLTPSKTKETQKEKPSPKSRASFLMPTEKPRSRSPIKKTPVKANFMVPKSPKATAIKKDKSVDLLVKLTVGSENDWNSNLAFIKPLVEPVSRSEETPAMSSKFNTDISWSDSQSNAHAAMQDSVSTLKVVSQLKKSSEIEESRSTNSLKQPSQADSRPLFSESIKDIEPTFFFKDSELEGHALSTALISIQYGSDRIATQQASSFNKPPLEDIPSRILSSSTLTTQTIKKPVNSRKIAPVSLMVSDKPPSNNTETIPAKKQEIKNVFMDEDIENRASNLNRAEEAPRLQPTAAEFSGLRGLIDKTANNVLQINRKQPASETDHSLVSLSRLDLGDCLGRKPSKRLSSNEKTHIQSFAQKEMPHETSLEGVLNSVVTLGRSPEILKSQGTEDLLHEVNDLCQTDKDLGNMPSDCKRAVLADIMNSLQRENLKDTLNIELLRKHMEHTLRIDKKDSFGKVCQDGAGDTPIIPKLSRNYPKRVLLDDEL